MKVNNPLYVELANDFDIKNPFTSKYETETDELDTDNALSLISFSTLHKDQQARSRQVSDLSSNTLPNYDNMNEKKHSDSMTSISSSSLMSNSSKYSNFKSILDYFSLSSSQIFRMVSSKRHGK
jgi:hypothetical protein